MAPRIHPGTAALLLSLLTHGVALWWLTASPPPLPPVRTVTAEFIFTEPPAAPEPEPEVEPEAPPPPVERPAPRAKPPLVKQAVPASEPDDAPVELAPSDAPMVAQVEADVPRAPPSLSLRPDAIVIARMDAGVETEIIAPTGLHALEAPKDIVGDLARETIGRGRVDRGLVHPYYSELGKALLKTWDAERVAKSGLKGLIEQTGENFKQYNEIWADRAAAYGKGGSPIDVTGPAGGRRNTAPNEHITTTPGVDLEQRKELQRSMAAAFKATRRAIIRVVQAPDGRVLRVELVQPSNDSRVDKEALIDVKNAAQTMPAPPAEALEGKTQLASLWSFELQVSISPPVPTFTFEFDEALGFIDARLPLDRRIYKKVRLVSVE